MANSTERPPSDSLVREVEENEAIKVFLRVRPATLFELTQGGNRVCFQAVNNEDCLIDVQERPDPFTFTFDHVFDQFSTQTNIFEVVGIPTVDNALVGYNSTIIAYGQRGSGKTHTMVGNFNDDKQHGLIPRILQYLFKRIQVEEALNPSPRYKVTFSSLEIYNEKLIDLLNPNSTNLVIRKDTKYGLGIKVVGLKEVEVKCCNDALDLIEIGNNCRRVAATDTTIRSHRSHCVHACEITRTQKSEDGSENTCITRLKLVDLAGSERTAATEEKNVHILQESHYIRKSLACLCRVIEVLANAAREGSKVHVPYRDSKLTTLLQESLGENAKTTIIAGISPMSSSYNGSLSTLQLLQRFKPIKEKTKTCDILKKDYCVAIHTENKRVRAQIKEMKSGGDRLYPKDMSVDIRGSIEPEPELICKIREQQECIVKLEAQIEEMKRRSHRLYPKDMSVDICGSIERDPETENKIREHEEHIEELEAQLEEVQYESERAFVQNKMMHEEISFLKSLKTELQTNIDSMMAEFTVWQDKMKEEEEIANKVLEAERSVYEEKLETEKQRILEHEAEKKERDAKITKMEAELEELVSSLSSLKRSYKEMETTLDSTKAHLDLKTIELEKLSEAHDAVTDCLRCSEEKCKDLDHKLMEANDQIKNQRGQLASLQNEIDKALAKSNELESDNARMKETIESLEETRSELKKKLGETERQLQLLERQRQDLRTEVECSNQKCGDLESKVAEANDSLKDQRSQITTLQNELDQTIVKAAEFEIQNAGLKQTIDHLEEVRTELRKNLNDTEILVQKQEREKQYLNTEVQLFQQKCSDLESNLNDAHEQLKEQRTQPAIRDSELKRVNTKVDECETDNAGLRQTIDSLESSRADLKKKLNESEFLVQNLERQKQDLEAEVECLQSKGGDLDTKLADVYDQLKEQRTQLTQRVSELERVTAKTDEYQNENTALKQNVEALREARSELRRKLHETELTVNELERKKQDLEGQVQEWEEKSGDLESKLTDAIERLKEQKSQLATRDNELDRMTAKAEEYASINAEFKENMATLEEAHSELRQKVHETEIFVQKLDREKQHLNTEVQCWQNKCEDLEAASEDLRSQIYQQTKLARERDVEIRELKSQYNESLENNQELEGQCKLHKSKIEKLESNFASLSKVVEQKDTEIGNLQRTKRDVESDLQMNEKQKLDLLDEIDRYVRLSRAQREELAAVKARFDRTRFEHHEEMHEKESEIKCLEEYYQAQVAGKEVKMVEAAKHHEEILHKHQEDYQSTVDGLQAIIHELKADKENKLKQYLEDKTELEARHKAANEELKNNSIERDNQWANQVQDLMLRLHRKENESRDMTAKHNSEMAALRCRLEEQTSRFHVELNQRESACADEIFQIKQDSMKQTLRLEESVKKYKELAAEKQTVIDFNEIRLQEIKREVEQCRTEINRPRIEFEESSSKVENENNAEFEQYEDYIKGLQKELKSRDAKILALEECLEDPEGYKSTLKEEYEIRLKQEIQKCRKMTNRNHTFQTGS
eukprot:g8141.t1